MSKQQAKKVDYADTAYQGLKSAYGDKFTLSIDEFKQKTQDLEYLAKAYDGLKSAYGDKFTINQADFASRFKKKEKTILGVSSPKSLGGGDRSEITSNPLSAEIDKQNIKSNNQQAVQKEVADILSTPILKPEEKPEFDLSTEEGLIALKTKELEERSSQAEANIREDVQSQVDAGILSLEDANIELISQFESAKNAIFSDIEKEFDEENSLRKEREKAIKTIGSNVLAKDNTFVNTERKLSKEKVTELDIERKKKKNLYNKIANEALESLKKLPNIKSPGRGKREPFRGDPNLKGQERRIAIIAQRQEDRIKNRSKRSSVHKENLKIRKRNNQIDITRSTLEYISNLTSGESKGFFSGLGAQGEEMIPFIGSISKISDLIEKRNIINKPENERTESEQMMVNAIAMYNSFERAGLKPTPYEWGEMVGQMIPFIGEFAVTGGAFSLAAKTTGKALLKTGLKRGVANYTIRGVAGAISQATANPQRYINTSIERQTDLETAIINQDTSEFLGTKKVKKGEEVLEASTKAYLINISEMLTERLGFAYGAGATRFLKSKVGKKIISEETIKKATITAFAEKHGLTTSVATKEAVKKLGFNGVLKEVWGEEVPNAALNELITGDSGKSLLESLNPLDENILKIIVPMIILRGGIYTPALAKKGIVALSKNFQGKEEARIIKTFGNAKVITGKTVTEAKKKNKVAEAKVKDINSQLEELVDENGFVSKQNSLKFKKKQKELIKAGKELENSKIDVRKKQKSLETKKKLNYARKKTKKSSVLPENDPTILGRLLYGVHEKNEQEVVNQHKVIEDAVPSEIVRGNNKYNVANKSGVLEIKDSKGKDIPYKIKGKTNSTYIRVVNEYKNKYNYDFGERAPSPKIEITQDKFAEHIAQNSKNAEEIAENWHFENENNKNAEQDYKTQILLDNVNNISEKSFIKIADKDLLSSYAKAKYLSNNKERSRPIDAVAKEISEDFGIEITPQEVADFIVENQGHVKKPKFNKGQEQLEQSFADLTGFNITPKIFDIILDKKQERLQIKEQEYETAIDKVFAERSAEEEAFQQSDREQAEKPNPISKTISKGKSLENSRRKQKEASPTQKAITSVNESNPLRTQIGAFKAVFKGEPSNESLSKTTNALESIPTIIRTEVSETKEIDGKDYRKLKIFGEGGFLTTVLTTPRGKVFSINKNGKPAPLEDNKLLINQQEGLFEALNSGTHFFKKPADNVSVPQESTNGKGGVNLVGKGKRKKPVAAKDNRQGQDFFQKDHPIKVEKLDGYVWYNEATLRTILSRFQNKGKLFGTIRQTIKTGKRRNSLGNYTRSTARIAVKNLSNINVIIHEVGHALDHKLDLLGMVINPVKRKGLTSVIKGGKDNTEIAYRSVKELLELSNFGSNPPTGLNATQAHEYKLGEGLAEFFKSMIFNPEMTKNKFPDTHKLIWENGLSKNDKSSFKEFSDQIRAWAGASAHVKTAGQIRSRAKARNWDIFKEKFIDVSDFYLTSADNWQAEASEALGKRQPIKALGLALKPARAIIANQFQGVSNTFQKQFLTRAFAFEMATKYMNNAKGLKQLPENDPTILGRLLYGMHEKFDDILGDGLKNHRGESLLDNGDKMTHAWLLGAFDNTDSNTIINSIEVTSAVMISERVIERYNSSVKTDVQPLIEKSSDLFVNKARLSEAVIVENGKGLFIVESKFKNPTLSGKFKSKKLAEESLNIVSRNIDKEIKNNKIAIKKGRTKAEKFHAEKIVTGIGGGIITDLDVARERVANHKANKKTNPKLYSMVEEGARRYRAYADGLLRYMVDKGRVSEDQYTKIKEFNEYYVAMQRVQEIGIDQEIEVYKKTSVGKVGAVFNPIKKFRGSGKLIEDPYASLINNAYSMTKEADRNDVLRAFIEPLSTDSGVKGIKVFDFTDIAHEVGESGPLTIPVFIKGEQKFYRFDKDIHTYLTGLGEAVYKLPWALTILPRVLRWGVTNAPPFAVKNRIRDYGSRLILSDTSSPFEKPAEFWSKEDSKNTKSLLTRFGGGQGGLIRDPTSYFKYDNVYYGVQDLAIREASKRKISILRPDQWGVVFKKYKNFLDTGERATRMQEFKSSFAKAKKDGLDNYNAGLAAAFESRDLLDFAVSGEVMSTINQLLPFTNAAVQGIRRAGRSIKENPDAFAGRMALYSMMPAAMIRLLNYSQGDDEEYLQQPAYLRDMFYLFKLGDQWIGIPKPFELGMGGSMTERMITKMIYAGSDQKKSDDAFDGFSGQLVGALFPFDETSISNIGGFGSFTEAQSNFIPFRDANIISTYENGLNLGLRSFESASEIGKGVRESINWAFGTDIDSRKIDHVIQSSSSYFGSAVVKATKRNGDVSFHPDDVTPGTIAHVLLRLSGVAKTDPIFSSIDVSWVMNNSAAFPKSAQEVGAINDIRDLMKDYFLTEDRSAKKALGAAIRSLAKAAKPDMLENMKEELIEAHYDRAARQMIKNLDVDLSADSEEIFERYIKNYKQKE